MIDEVRLMQFAIALNGLKEKMGLSRDPVSELKALEDLTDQLKKWKLKKSLASDFEYMSKFLLANGVDAETLSNYLICYIAYYDLSSGSKWE